ncbi:gamma-glutamyltranspeptidase/glutathione hydrolase [Cellulophaga sp. RHA_52]|uniref:gamma-glutamyltransferase n=1 Tax=Cellulophaga sp. RHA_52 TaxID=1250036 RepID=UPI00119B1CB6|nr:gamma-glutamyltransferase [Cellulophaga sp. RHA_52]TVZ08663.1 gamma-glutamyltranspeptidase/glutathione hydrolase [Cellulophaga sp. RHA_52]
MKYVIILSTFFLMCCCSSKNKVVKTEKKAIPSNKAMVCGTTGAEALNGGVTILKKGGSAMDAALSTALSQITLAAGSWVSYAGLMNIVYYDSETGKVYNMNASFNTVKNEKDPLSIPGSVSLDLTKKAPSSDGRSVLVPGFMAGVESAHQKFGNLPFAYIFENAIGLAENGIEWNSGLQKQFNYRKEILSRLPETKAVFTKSDGTFYKIGDTFTQPELAKTLKKVVKLGSNYMYNGHWAKKMVSVVQSEGGKLTLDDMKNYQVEWNEPLNQNYNNHELFVHGLPAVGGVNTIEALNLIEKAQFSKKPRYYEDPKVLKELSDIIKFGELFPYVKNALNAIPNLDISSEGRLKKENATVIYEIIKQGQLFGASPETKNTPKHSDAVVVIDEKGNICAMTHSINAVSWGGTGIFIDGVSIPDPASFQQQEVAKAGAGKRLPDPTNPGIIFKDGKPILGFASIGAGLHAKTITSLLAVMDYQMTPQEAIEIPNLGFVNFAKPQNGFPRTIDSTEFKLNVIDKANELSDGGFEHNTTMPGYWIGIKRDDAGNLHGSTVRKLNKGGRAVGY